MLIKPQTMDIVLLIKSDLIQLASRFTVPFLLKQITSGNIYLITNKGNFGGFEKLSSDPRLRFIDENEVVEGLVLSDIQNYLSAQIGSDQRAGWYFQQFLKLGIAYRHELSHNYLVWDADCVLLRPLQFITSEGKIIITKSKEFHPPYFVTINNLLNLERAVDFSFISEHMVFSRQLVKQMVSQIENNSTQTWWHTILDAVPLADLGESGFSEYETYGNFVIANDRNIFEFRELHVSRKGTELFGVIPTKLDLIIASLTYSYISFELWHEQLNNRMISYLKIVKSSFYKRKSRII